MPVGRSQRNKEVPINLVGSSVFGRYPKISIEKTLNMFQSDTFMVPYSGYQIAITSSFFRNGIQGRGVFTSTKLGRLVVVIDNNVCLVNINYNHLGTIITKQVTPIGQLNTYEGVVYITENNKPQILISDNSSLYLYDPNPTPPKLPFHAIPNLSFIPGYITFHDTYFICAASEDSFYNPPANNTWRLSGQNDGDTWANDAQSIGLLQSKPDNVKAVVRFPSKGNMILVMGSIVSEAWYDTGAQLFPYQRTNQMNIDYGCLSPATVAYMDEIVVWLAQNEKSGPIILYSDGGMPKKITTDGIDYLFAQLENPEDSQGFLYRQDGHLFYHINFYADNLSLFIDFMPDGSHRIYNASDQNLNYYIAAEVAFFNNQYYFVTKNNGNLFAMDTIFTTYQDVQTAGSMIPVVNEIPRIRTTSNIRLPSQDYFIANDVGFTIESGETNYQEQSTGLIYLVTQDTQFLVTQQGDQPIYFLTQNGQYLVDQQSDDLYLVSQQTDTTSQYYLVTQQTGKVYTTPCVDLSISTDGGASFGTEWRYELPPIGKRKNKVQWYNLGAANDLVLQFKFWGIGRAVFTDGVINIRI